MDTYYHPPDLAQVRRHGQGRAGAVEEVPRLVRRRVRRRRAHRRARRPSSRWRCARGAVPLLHRCLHQGVPREGLQRRADDRSRARGRRHSRRRIARPRRADAQRRRQAVACSGRRFLPRSPPWTALQPPAGSARRRAQQRDAAGRRCRWPALRRRRWPAGLRRCAPTGIDIAADQRRQALQPDLPALPRRCRARPPRDDAGDDVVDACLARAGAIRHPDARHHRRRARAAPALPRHRRRRRARLGRHVIDRCNLTITRCPSYADLPEFLAEHQRGSRGLAALLPAGADRRPARRRRVRASRSRRCSEFNALGYGVEGTRPGAQPRLQPGRRLPARPRRPRSRRDFKRELPRQYGVVFNRLFTITNMPISRFLEFLARRRATCRPTWTRLVEAFNPAAGAGVMCRNTLSVGWDGTLYDCDFNQMLDLPARRRRAADILDFDRRAALARSPRRPS